MLRRLKLLSFLSAAARATNALLQRMTQARIEFNSSSLLESLLAAHRFCSTSIESLSALAGSFGVPGLSTLLQVPCPAHAPHMFCLEESLDPLLWWPQGKDC